jgi:hypothetical protein
MIRDNITELKQVGLQLETIYAKKRMAKTDEIDPANLFHSEKYNYFGTN